MRFILSGENSNFQGVRQKKSKEGLACKQWDQCCSKQLNRGQEFGVGDYESCLELELLELYHSCSLTSTRTLNSHPKKFRASPYRNFFIIFPRKRIVRSKWCRIWFQHIMSRCCIFSVFMNKNEKYKDTPTTPFATPQKNVIGPNILFSRNLIIINQLMIIFKGTFRNHSNPIHQYEITKYLTHWLAYYDESDESFSS